MLTSWDGIRFICCREAYSRVSYEDPAGSGRYSYGFGYQGPPGQPVQPGDTIEIHPAFLQMIGHIRNNDDSLSNYFEREVPQFFWNAFSCLFYQRGSTPPRELAPRINSGEPFWLIATEFLRYNSGADGVPTEGHTKRRVREMNLALNGDYGDISKFKYYENNPRASSPIMMEFPPPESLNVLY